MRALLFLPLLLLASPAQAQTPPDLTAALQRAAATVRAAQAVLGARAQGVPLDRYAQALSELTLQTDTGPIPIRLVIRDDATGECARFAAYVAPVDGTPERFVFFCPQFFTPGRDGLRDTTVLHEWVHLLAGPDECRAMAVTAAVEQAASGTHTPVEAYWQQHGCADSRFRLP